MTKERPTIGDGDCLVALLVLVQIMAKRVDLSGYQEEITDILERICRNFPHLRKTMEENVVPMVSGLIEQDPDKIIEEFIGGRALYR